MARAALAAPLARVPRGWEWPAAGPPPLTPGTTGSMSDLPVVKNWRREKSTDKHDHMTKEHFATLERKA